MTLPDFRSASQHAIELLEHKLSISYTYHSMKHTCEEVVGMTDRLATLEGIDGTGAVAVLSVGAAFMAGKQQTTNHRDGRSPA